MVAPPMDESDAFDVESYEVNQKLPNSLAE